MEHVLHFVTLLGSDTFCSLGYPDRALATSPFIPKSPSVHRTLIALCCDVPKERKVDSALVRALE